jgi:hypothetical protein
MIAENAWLATHPDVRRLAVEVAPGTLYRDRRRGALWVVVRLARHCRTLQNVVVLDGAGGECLVCPIADLCGGEMEQVELAPRSEATAGRVSGSVHG